MITTMVIKIITKTVMVMIVRIVRMIMVVMMMVFLLSHSFSILLDWLCMLVS